MNGSKRTISRILAFVMLVSAMFTNVIAAGTDVDGTLGVGDVISAVSEISEDAPAVDEDAPAADEDAAVDEEAPAADEDAAVEEDAPAVDEDAAVEDAPAVDEDAAVDSAVEENVADLFDGEEDIEGHLTADYKAEIKAFANGETIFGDDTVGYMKSIDPNGFKTASDNVGSSKLIHAEDKDYAYANGVVEADVINTFSANTNGDVLEFSPLVNGTVKILFKVNNTLSFNVFGSAGESNYGTNSYFYREVAVEAGQTYKAGITGGKLRVFYLGFTPEKKGQDVGGDGAELGTPEAGKTYTEDLAAELGTLGLAAQTALPDKEFITSDKMLKIVNTTGTSMYHGASYGLALKSGDSLEIAVAGNADLTFTLSKWGAADGKFTITDSEGTSVGELEIGVENDNDKKTYNYIGGATVLKLAYSGAKECYIPKVEIANKNAVTGDAKSFSFMLDDIAKDVDGTKTIKVGKYEKSIERNDGTSIDLGDTVIEFVGQGTNDFTPYKPEQAAFGGITRDGRSGLDAYCAGKRHATPNDIKTIPVQGDGTCIIVKPVADGMLKVFTATSKADAPLGIFTFDPDGARIGGQVLSPVAPESYALNVTGGNTYVFSASGKTNDFAFVGIDYVLPEQIDVTFNWDTKVVTETGYDFSGVSVTMVDADLGGTPIKVNYDSKDPVKLLKGHTYSIDTGDGGCEATSNGNKFFKVTGDTVDLLLTEIPNTTLTGKFIGLGTAADVTKVEFVSMTNGAVFEPTIDVANNSYSIDTIKPGDYNTLVYSDKYMTKDRARVALEGSTDDIYLESLVKSRYDLPYEIKAPGSAVQFSATVSYNNDQSVGAKNGDTIVIPVNGKQKITVAGWNSGAWNINGDPDSAVQITSDNKGSASNPITSSYVTNGTDESVTINITDATTTTYLYWVTVEDVTNWDADNTTIQVPTEQFPTLKSAVAYIRNMEDRPAGEDGRMTIELVDDVQEQIVFDAPYITVKGNGHEINWYYGQTGAYYSCDKDGYYDESLFYDKFDKTLASGSLWGGVAIIRGDYFRAENTVFRNTFNYEVTPKEIEDGAENRNSIKGIITADTDVQVFDAKERSNAFYIDAKGIECYNCSILSSQDTLGRNSDSANDYSAYFKYCTIGGNVDYICGLFSAVFDDCELQWFSYANDPSHNTATAQLDSKGSINSGVGAIAAPKSKPYVFRNCTVTTRGAEGKDEVKGLWGRTWGTGSQVYFLNCVANDHILDWGWGEMNSGEGASSDFNEYGNTTDGTTAFKTAGATFGKELTDQAKIDSYTGKGIIDDVLAGWDPEYYDAPEPPKSLWGDVDGDEDVDATDAALVYNYVLSHSNITAADTFIAARADVDEVEGVDSADVATILQKALNGSWLMPVEKTGHKAPESDPKPVTPPTTDLPATTLWVVGDSTGCHYADTADMDLYYKRVGFGDKFADYLNDKVTVENKALSGRSSKSFTSEAAYTDVLNGMKQGDYLLIAFGHNDEKANDSARYTFPSTTANPTTKDTEGSFKNSLYANYIKPALDKGVTPILVSPIVRLPDSAGAWADGKLHKANGGDYKQDVIDLAKEVGVACVDATTLTKNLYDDLGYGKPATLDAATGTMSEPTGANALHSAGNNGAPDATHINNYGAKYVAYLITEALKASTCELGKYVKDGNAAPTTADLVVNPAWTAPAASEPTGSQLVSKLFKTTQPWNASAFGNMGGASKIRKGDPNAEGQYLDEVAETNGVPNFIVEEGQGTVRLKAGDPQGTGLGKIEIKSSKGGNDGLLLYYQESSSQSVQISATVTVNDFKKDDAQVGFGAIILDKIDVDTNIKAEYTPWVASGLLANKMKVGGTENSVANFARLMTQTTADDGSVSDISDVICGKGLTNSVNKGDKFSVKVVKVGNKFTTTTTDLQTNETVTDEFTADMSGVTYVGLFAARAADVTFSDFDITNQVVE